jgi:hypothetical protein
VAQVGHWLAQTARKSIEGDLFDALKDGQILCSVALKLAPQSSVRVNKQATPGNFACAKV